MSTAFADVIVFATPVSETIRLMNELPKWQLKKQVIVTDTGSTKKEIMKAADIIKRTGHYVYRGTSDGRLSQKWCGGCQSQSYLKMPIIC